MKVLVAGSYPPVPGPAAAATLAAVRAAWADGDDVLVVSPRPGAADHYAHLQGWRAVAALARLSRGRDRLVLVGEPGVPFAWAAHAAAARALAWMARRRFKQVTVWVVSPDLLPPVPWTAFWAAADRIVVATEEDRGAVIDHLGGPGGIIDVDPSGRLRSSRVPFGAGAVSPLGPPEWTWREQPRRLASMMIRRILGRHTDAVRDRVVSAGAALRARRAGH